MASEPAVPMPIRLAALGAMIVVICAVDLLTPPPVNVHVLLAVPVVLTATSPDRDEPLAVFVLALAALGIVVLLGGKVTEPTGVFAANTFLAVLLLTVGFVVARALQHQRQSAEAARADATAHGDLNRLLLSLLAHDLRAPLTTAGQAMDYVVGAIRNTDPIDVDLLDDVRARLRRSLRATEIVLDVARRDLAAYDTEPEFDLLTLGTHSLAEQLEAEARSFELEASAAGSTLVTDWDGIGGGTSVAEPLVVRQALSIVLDNAIRHARPGTIDVRGTTGPPGQLCIAVTDPGPRPAASRQLDGSGLGLELCRALLDSAGGRIEWRADDGGHTRVRLFVPTAPAPAPPQQRQQSTPPRGG